MAPTVRPSADSNHSMILKLALIALGATSAAIQTCAAPTPCTVTWGGTKLTGQEQDGVCRYSLRYGRAERWGESVLADGSTNAVGMPPACPQISSSFSMVDGVLAEQSEDCLYAVIYAPKKAKGLPVFTWIHGGSGHLGWAGYPGVEGSHLAREGGMIVVVPQYRLGALGFLPPPEAESSSDPNLAVKDVILALKAIKSRIHIFGGDNKRITLAGHSSGGQIVRAIIAAPSAKGLYHRLILQSDSLMFGLSSPRLTGELQRSFYSAPKLAGKSLAELRTAPLSDFLAVKPAEIPGIPLSMPFRPTFGTVTVPNEPTSSLFYNPGALAMSPSSIPLLITTVAHEGATTTGEMLKTPLPLAGGNANLRNIMAVFVDIERATTLLNTAPYALPATSEDADIVRSHFERVVTDIGYRCVARSAAQKWAAAGGKVYVGEWNRAPQYFYSALNPYCAGKTCHQDDIYPVFGEGTDAGLNAYVLSQWGSFVRDGAPRGWKAFTADTGIDGRKVVAIGGGEVPECPEGVFGNIVQWDWQMYNF